MRVGRRSRQRLFESTNPFPVPDGTWMPAPQKLGKAAACPG